MREALAIDADCGARLRECAVADAETEAMVLLLPARIEDAGDVQGRTWGERLNPISTSDHRLNSMNLHKVSTERQPKFARESKLKTESCQMAPSAHGCVPWHWQTRNLLGAISATRTARRGANDAW